MPTVSVQVLPRDSGDSAVVQSSFALLDYADPEQPDILYVEHVAGSLQREGDSAVRAATVALQDLSGRALSCADSLRFVERVAAELEGGRCGGGTRFRTAVASEQPKHRGNNANCVEVAFLEAAVAVRDSKDPDGPALVVSPRSWANFLRASGA